MLDNGDSSEGGSKENEDGQQKIKRHYNNQPSRAIRMLSNLWYTVSNSYESVSGEDCVYMRGRCIENSNQNRIELKRSRKPSKRVTMSLLLWSFDV